MKIGILTYHSTLNYGAHLQSVSLYRFLSDTGHQVELINFMPPSQLWFELKQETRLLLKERNDRAGWQRKRKLFKESLASFARLSGNCVFSIGGVEALALNKYDALIAGSDEVWNFSSYRGYQPAYLLGLSSKYKGRRISYAASMGSFHPTADMVERIRGKLVKFSSILVRDYKTLSFVKNDLGLCADQVVDPTMLVDLPCDRKDIGVKYAVLTGGLSKAQIHLALEICERRGLKPLALGYVYPGLERELATVAPMEWVSYINGASLVISSLFHASVFAIKAGCPFLVFRTLGKEHKILDLLSLFDLKACLIDTDATVEDVDAQLNGAQLSVSAERKHSVIADSQAKLLRALS